MDNENNVMVPFFVHEAVLTRMERINKRLWILCFVLLIALIGSNVGWLYYESQWQVMETTTVTQDLDSGEGGTNIINDGVHINGKSETNSN